MSFVLLALVLGGGCGAVMNRSAAAAEPAPLAEFEAAVPRQSTEFTAARVEILMRRAAALRGWLAAEGERPWSDNREEALSRVAVMTAAKRRVDVRLEKLLELRTEFAALPEGAEQREHARQFLAAASNLIDLSGRMRYLLRDAIDAAAYVIESDDAALTKLVDILAEQRSSIGAAVVSYLLQDAPDPDIPPVPWPLRQKLLELIVSTRQSDLLPPLAAALLSPQSEPRYVVALAETIRELGLPQDMRPGQDPTLPRPALTAARLSERLAQLDRQRLTPAEIERLDALLAWSQQRAERGIAGDSLRVAGFDLQAGDWLLMRNPSPYNHFTDLAPGLFTHVGVVAVETDDDGRRRLVIVEMPERSATIPATNVDAYLLRTLHYFFLRHDDPAVAGQMAEAAASMIGNESQFDLHFRTDRVLALRGQPLAGRPIHTYCAGFLLLCALQTELPREAFFPLAEHAPGDNCQLNLAKLGMAIGDDFISPTGALFSPQLRVVARRRPMYEPTREVKEAVYDHFAARMIHDTLTPSPNAYQSLREKLAGMSKRNPWLARALARANNVSQQLDLESAAKAAAVVETLDEIADSAMNEFIAARSAFLAGPPESLAERGYSEEQIRNVEAYRRRHAELWRPWTAGTLSPRALRVALVTHYMELGRQRLDARFFHGETAP